MKNIRMIFGIFIIMALLFASVPAPNAYAYSYLRVNQTADTDDGSCTSVHCTLREAIHYASSGETIDFAPAMSGQTIVLDDGPLVIDEDLTIDGSALSNHVIVSGDNTMIVFVIGDNDVTFNNLDITEAHYGLYGGGIYNNGSNNTISVNDVAFYDNQAHSGAAIGSKNGGTIVVTNSTFTDNVSSSGCGGAIFMDNGGVVTITNSEFASNEAVLDGGAVCLSSGSITVENSTFTSNYAEYHGGAIHLQPYTSITILNSTIFANQVGTHSSSQGGGIFVDNDAEITLSNVTLSNNRAQYGGGLYLDTDASTAVTNTIFANSVSGYDCYNNGAVFTTNIGNLIESNAPSSYACAVPAVSVDPQLGRLSDNGGPTRTMSIGSGSPALDAGNNAVCESTDQRGYSRPVDGDGDHSSVCDIGAYELQ